MPNPSHDWTIPQDRSGREDQGIGRAAGLRSILDDVRGIPGGDSGDGSGDRRDDQGKPDHSAIGLELHSPTGVARLVIVGPSCPRPAINFWRTNRSTTHDIQNSQTFAPSGKTAPFSKQIGVWAGSPYGIRRTLLSAQRVAGLPRGTGGVLPFLLASAQTVEGLSDG